LRPAKHDASSTVLAVASAFLFGLVPALQTTRVDLVNSLKASDATRGVPILMIWVGAINPQILERALRDGTVLPGLHSSLFAPDPQPTIMTGVEALVTSARALFGTAR
jgi:hypothetical protein